MAQSTPRIALDSHSIIRPVINTESSWPRQETTPRTRHVLPRSRCVFVLNVQLHRLEHVEHELVAAVVSAILRILVVPLAIVNRNPHFGRISVILIFRTSVIVLSPEVLRIIDIRIVIKAVHIPRTGLTTPYTPVSMLLSFRLGWREADAERRGAENAKQNSPSHLIPLKARPSAPHLALLPTPCPSASRATAL